jgi:hypothetical protein
LKRVAHDIWDSYVTNIICNSLNYVTFLYIFLCRVILFIYF